MKEEKSANHINSNQLSDDNLKRCSNFILQMIKKYGNTALKEPSINNKTKEKDRLDNSPEF